MKNKNAGQREIATTHTKEVVHILWNQQKYLTKTNKDYQRQNFEAKIKGRLTCNRRT